MISSIFDKRKPINFIIIAVYLFLYFMISRYLLFQAEISFFSIAYDLGVLILLIITAFGADLLNNKHNLSAKNAYAMLIFAMALSLFPRIFTDENIILSHAFALLSIGRLLDLSNEVNPKQKIFDAALWISVAALFYAWTVLYFIVIYMAIVLYTPKSYSNWLIPPVAVTAVLLLCYTYFLWFRNDTDILSVFSFTIQWQYLKYSATNYFIPFVFLAAMSFVATLSYGIRAVRKRTLQQSKGFLIITSLLIGASMVLFFGNEHRTTLIFMTFPLSVLFTNYLERLKKKWIKESLFLILLLAPVVLLMLQFGAVR